MWPSLLTLVVQLEPIIAKILCTAWLHHKLRNLTLGTLKPLGVHLAYLARLGQRERCIVLGDLRVLVPGISILVDFWSKPGNADCVWGLAGKRARRVFGRRCVDFEGEATYGGVVYGHVKVDLGVLGCARSVLETMSV